MAALHEIIEALDRRGPQIESAGEVRIARDALRLRREAVQRLDELTQAADDAGRRHALVDGGLADDGGA